MTQPESDSAERFYPGRWRLTIHIDEAVITQYEPVQGHHLAAAAKELLTLYTGTGSHAFGMLDPGNRASIHVDLEPIE